LRVDAIGDQVGPLLLSEVSLEFLLIRRALAVAGEGKVQVVGRDAAQPGGGRRVEFVGRGATEQREDAE